MTESSHSHRANGKACDHHRTVEGRWERNPHYNPNEDDGYTGDPYEWIPEHSVLTAVDIDVRHMRCTQCGEIIPYCGSNN